MLLIYLAALDTEEERDKLTFLYEKYKGLLKSAAMKVIRDRDLADDAVHETFMEAIRHKEKILSLTPIDFRNWSVIVVRRKCIDAIRKRTRYGGTVSLDADNAPEVADEGEPFGLQMIRQEDYDRLMECIDRLDPVNRQILEMKYVLDMSIAEICSELDMTLAQVNSRLERTRQKVRHLFNSRGEMR
jgi:RNA polymerase sigma-70 factor (ECF subfamily)